MVPASAQSTTRRGQWAETLALTYLQARGYRLLQRNFRCQLGEIDLIAQHDDVLCFIEVRSRRSDAQGHPLETIGAQKIRHLIGAAQTYISRLRGPWPPMRFDVVAILLTQPPHISLLTDAFDACQ